MNHFDELLNLRDKQRLVGQKQPIVIKGKDVAWEDNQHGKMKWFMHPCFESAWNAYVLYIQQLNPGFKSGRQRCQGGVLFYLLEGRLRTKVNGELYDWGAGDLLTLPILRDGVEYQHLNVEKEDNATFLACEINTAHSLGVDKGSGFEELEACGKIYEKDLDLGNGQRVPDAVQRTDAPATLSTQYDRDFQRWKQIRERYEKGNLLVRGSDMSWEQNRMGKVCYYLNPEFERNALLDWTVFAQDIRLHTGKHKHQGGLIIYVTDGEGYTICDGTRYDWQADDLILFPVKPGGVEHQHFNTKSGAGCRWIVMFYWPWWEQVASEFVQFQHHPDFH